MKGFILLEGGAEFQGQMAAPDGRAVELAGGLDAPIVIIPTAAAPDNNHRRAGNNGVRWFQSLGARQVTALELIDRASANQPGIAETIRTARLVYLLGGFTHYLGQTLADSLCLDAMREAYQAGSVFGWWTLMTMAGSEQYYNPETGRFEAGLGFVPGACVIPHHNTFGKGWAPKLADKLPGVVLIGIDEQTGVMDDGPQGRWQVYGKGAVTLYRGGGSDVFFAGETREKHITPLLF